LLTFFHSIPLLPETRFSLDRGRKIYETARYMSPAVALEQTMSLLEAGEAPSLIKPETLCITISRVGSNTQKLIAGSLKELSELPEEAFGGPLHSMVILGSRLHPMERDFALQFAVDRASWTEKCNVFCGKE
jgi:diphthine synthase